MPSIQHHLADLARIKTAQHADYLDAVERREGKEHRAAVQAALHQELLVQARRYALEQSECER